MSTRASSGDVDSLIQEACAKANAALNQLLPQGPTKALLALYVARAEVLRIAEERVPRAEWNRFLLAQEQLERAFDARCEPLKAANRSLIILSGSYIGAVE
ncbi:MAG TPA: hypothetical protein VGP93_13110 [Polyangiaceae bacterium]|jgi:hypothetical protein|nr:hypothetical protein [Polyangiaceae bacterium]